MQYRVAVHHCSDYDPEHLRSALIKCMRPWGGLRSILDDANSVLLKLNLLSAAPPEAAVTTHPAFAKEVIHLLHDEGIRVCMGDSPGGIQNPKSYRKLLEVTGIADVSHDTNCPVVFFDADLQEIHSAKSRTFKRFLVPRVLSQVDAVIALPRFKTHQLTTITGAVKLLYGYLPGTMKAEYHLHTGKKIATFAELLCDLYATFPPTFTFMDAIVAMEGNGPRHGHPHQAGILLSGASGPAIDFVMSDLAGFNPSRIPVLRTAAERGLGPARWEEIEMCGEPRERLSCRNFLPPDAHRLLYVPEFFISAAQRFVAARPIIDPQRCRACGICVANCPAHAITGRSNYPPIIQDSRCICCFCCQELCPSNAIHVQLPLLRKIIRR